MVADARQLAFAEGWQELVVAERCLADVQQHATALLRRARRVWLVPSADGRPVAETVAALFSDPLPRAGRVLKRGFDVVLSVVALLLAAPVLVVAAMAVKCDTRGPAFFKQARAGANGRSFRIYKLRTMETGNDDSRHRTYVSALIHGHAQANCGVYKLVDDRRITRVGRVLRRFSLDELPQLWNVLRGDMSLVGPRPPLLSEIDQYGPAAWQRLRVKPGMTGLWQVSGRCRVPFEQMVALDERYWRSWSLLLDLRILLRTPGAVMSGDGAA